MLILLDRLIVKFFCLCGQPYSLYLPRAWQKKTSSLIKCVFTGLGKGVVPRLPESRLLTSLGRKFTQPRDHSFPHPCTSICSGWNARFESDLPPTDSLASVSHDDEPTLFAIPVSQPPSKVPRHFFRRPWITRDITTVGRSGRQCFLDDGLSFRKEDHKKER